VWVPVDVKDVIEEEDDDDAVVISRRFHSPVCRH
jgi:hypothetical protein